MLAVFFRGDLFGRTFFWMAIFALDYRLLAKTGTYGHLSTTRVVVAVVTSELMRGETFRDFATAHGPLLNRASVLVYFRLKTVLTDITPLRLTMIESERFLTRIHSPTGFQFFFT